MKIGIRVPCYRRWCGPTEAKAIAVLAEGSGFDSLWVQDHLVAPLGPASEISVQGVDDWMSDRAVADASQVRSSERTTAPTRPTTLFQYYAGDDWWLDPFTVWAFLAGVTSRITLASDIIVVPYRNPVVQAKMLGTLDVLSNGRMLLGTGSGHVQAESRAIGVDFAARGRMHDEHVRVIKAILSGEEAAFAGEFTNFGPLRTLIRSVQQPHLPIYIGGNGPRSIRRAAELGDGWLPSAAGPEGLAKGIEELRRACAAIGREDVPPVAVSLPKLIRLPVEGRSLRTPAMTPREAIDVLRAYEAAGADHVSLGFLMPTASVYLDQIEQFATDVLPAFRG